MKYIKKYFIYILIIILLGFGIYALNNIFFSKIKFKQQTKIYICDKTIPLLTNFILSITTSQKFKGKNLCSHIYNDYNTKFLPETQLVDFNFNKININEYKYKHFYIEFINNSLFTIEKYGKIKFSKNYKNFLNNNIVFDELETNAPEIIKGGEILDTYIHKDKIFISYFFNKNDSCQKFAIAEADIQLDNFLFKDFIIFDECHLGTDHINGGRLQAYIYKNTEGLLLTTGAKKESRSLAQKDDSIYGKVLFINIKDKSYNIFAKGLRNPQGLYVKDNIIITSEHGPRGGDELNKIAYGQNYGWPIASYGEPYGGGGSQKRNTKYLEKNFYKKSHERFDFIEPIFSYVPSIGASELIKIPDNLHPKWKNNFLLSSLSGLSLYRIQFAGNYSKIVLSEKIFIGQRIRDIKYDLNSNSIFLAMESLGQIGILTPKLSN